MVTVRTDRLLLPLLLLLPMPAGANEPPSPGETEKQSSILCVVQCKEVVVGLGNLYPPFLPWGFSRETRGFFARVLFRACALHFASFHRSISLISK
uniref:Putative secreted protein n=1 Tax=Anopheles darlingi TaxID=43151 RepID=A0A2M4DEK2_ANODA